MHRTNTASRANNVGIAFNTFIGVPRGALERTVTPGIGKGLIPPGPKALSSTRVVVH
jgi:hypothetical protein